MNIELTQEELNKIIFCLSQQMGENKSDMENLQPLFAKLIEILIIEGKK